MDMVHFRSEWAPKPMREILAGTVVALALIPEAIAFSLIAGVDPQVGLYASFCIAVVSAIVGGRPGMISAATAATALLMITLVKEHGLQYLLAATLLTGERWRAETEPVRSLVFGGPLGYNQNQQRHETEEKEPQCGVQSADRA
jgi:hypothetical protein